MDVTIRPLRPEDGPEAVRVAESLPEWFSPDGIAEITRDTAHQAGAIAEAGGRVVGFITWVVDGPKGELAWIGVAPDRHGTGVGRRLIEMADQALREAGVEEVFVETLGESVEYEPYDRTRAFYRAVGFTDFESWATDNPGMPEVLRLRKAL